MPENHTADSMTVRRDDPDDVVARLEEDIIFGRLAPGARRPKMMSSSSRATTSSGSSRRTVMASAV